MILKIWLSFTHCGNKYDRASLSRPTFVSCSIFMRCDCQWCRNATQDVPWSARSLPCYLLSQCAQRALIRQQRTWAVFAQGVPGCTGSLVGVEVHMSRLGTCQELGIISLHFWTEGSSSVPFMKWTELLKKILVVSSWYKEVPETTVCITTHSTPPR